MRSLAPVASFPTVAQQHFVENREAWQARALAASGVEWRQRQRWERNAREMETALDVYCEPIPEARDFLQGIADRNNNRDNAGQLWEVVCAISVHRFRRLTALMMYQALHRERPVKAWCKICHWDTQKSEEANSTTNEGGAGGRPGTRLG